MFYCSSLREEQVRKFFASARHTDVGCMLHIHATAEILLVTGGELGVQVGNRQYTVRSGQGVFIAPYEPHRFYTPQHSRCHVLMFSRELIGYFWEQPGRSYPIGHLFSVSPASLELAENILPLDYNEADYIGALAVLGPLCYDIARDCTFGVMEEDSDDLLEKAIGYIDGHFTQELSLKDVAKAVGCHPVTLSKAFNKKTGIGFVGYVQYLRCAYGAGLIRQGRQTLTQVAFSSGFGSIRSFNRAFVRVYGMTPNAFKNSENAL